MKTAQTKPAPAEYVEMMRHYLPGLPIQAVKDAWKHNATPAEVREHLNRIKAGCSS